MCDTPFIYTLLYYTRINLTEKLFRVQRSIGTFHEKLNTMTDERANLLSLSLADTRNVGYKLGRKNRLE